MISRNKLKQCRSGCITLDGYRIHHSQVSVGKEIFEASEYSEAKDDEVKEDCVFCYRVFDLPGIKSAYIGDPLSKYIASHGMQAFKDGIE